MKMKRIYNTYKVELFPKSNQYEYLYGACDATRFVFNWALGNSILHYNNTGEHIGVYELSKRLTCLKKLKQYSWLNQYSDSILRNALWDFWDALVDVEMKSIRESTSFPQFKSKKSEKSFTDRIVELTKSQIKFPKLGWVRLKQHGIIPIENTKIIKAVVSRNHSDGEWYVTVTTQENIVEPEKLTGELETQI